MSDVKYSFLRGLVANIADVQQQVTDDDNDVTQSHHHHHQQSRHDDVTGPRRPRGRSLELRAGLSRHHSFPQHAQFSAEPRNLPVAAELCFRGILRNSVLASNKGTNTAYFGRFQVAIVHVYVISP